MFLLNSTTTYDVLRETVSACMEQGYLPKGDIDTVSFALWSTVHGMVSLIIRERCVMIPEEHRRAVLYEAFTYMTNRSSS